jgi:hypothetical protein
VKNLSNKQAKNLGDGFRSLPPRGRWRGVLRKCIFNNQSGNRLSTAKSKNNTAQKTKMKQRKKPKQNSAKN